MYILKIRIVVLDHNIKLLITPKEKDINSI